MICSIVDRFWSKVDMAGMNKCWIWMGSKDKNGYGRLNCKLSNGKFSPVLAHRISMSIYLDRVLLDSEKVLHDCPTGDNPSCVNPLHLWLGTIADNNRDKMEKGRFRHHGRCKAEENGLAKLTNAEVVEIRRCFRAGIMNQITLARKYKMHHSTIHDIVFEKSWRSIL